MCVCVCNMCVSNEGTLNIYYSAAVFILLFRAVAAVSLRIAFHSLYQNVRGSDDAMDENEIESKSDIEHLK